MTQSLSTLNATRGNWLCCQLHKHQMFIFQAPQDCLKRIQQNCYPTLDLCNHY